MDTTTSPTLDKVTRHAGIAGQFEVSAEVTYPGEQARTVAFVGSVYGGPVVMVTPSSLGQSVQTFVSDPGRHGDFAVTPIEWVHRFFGVT